VAISETCKIDFKKYYESQRHFILIKESIQQGFIKIISIYVSNNRAQKYIKQKNLSDFKGEINSYYYS